MDLFQAMRVFVRVVETGSSTTAARSLNVSTAHTSRGCRQEALVSLPAASTLARMSRHHCRYRVPTSLRDWLRAVRCSGRAFTAAH